MTSHRSTRRRLLRTSVLSLALVSGCSDADTGDADTPDRAGGTRSNRTSGETTTPSSGEGTSGPSRSVGTTGDTVTSRGSETGALTEQPSVDDFDLREANVVAVETTRTGDRYRFDVTLYHDDDGENGYADWWQVETLSGERLGRRELLHPHGTREFTRSATISIPQGATCVVVRGHDQTHGYGGLAALVDPTGGATQTVGQGPTPDAFDSTDCPAR